MPRPTPKMPPNVPINASDDRSAKRSDVAANSVPSGSSSQAVSPLCRIWKRLPEAEALSEWLMQLTTEDRDNLLAHCIGMTADALQSAHRVGTAPEHADKIATALGLDMRTWWRPTHGNFLGRITKNDILAAVSEGVSQQASCGSPDSRRSAW